MSTVLTNLSWLDTENGRLVGGMDIVIEGDSIQQVAPGAGASQGQDSQRIDLGGRVVMPGLIDCHVHLHKAPSAATPFMLPALVTAHAGATLQDMLNRGFTTVRDAGGVDAGLRQAVEQDLFEGPRLFVSGHAISQTGGHGDVRSPAEFRPLCDCAHLMPAIGRVADGVPEVRKAVRDEIRMGADQVKVMAGGGVASLHDPIAFLQYSMEELEAVVDEATRAQTYVMAHVYTAEGIERCVRAGVRTIEHGHFVDDRTAALMAEHGTYLCINLFTYEFLVNEGLQMGYLKTSIEKAKEVLDVGVKAVEIAQRAGVKIAFGTDLARTPQRQGEEFLSRSAVMTAADSIRSATVIGAEVVRMPGRIGVVKPGALADLLVLDGNPLDDISILARGGETARMVFQEGKIVKNLLETH